MAKRLFDILISITAILIFLPVLFIVAMLIFISDFGPIIYCQKRVGYLGREFEIYKFRSMVVNADRLGGYSTQHNDSRITRIGRFIRRTSLDELPQLFNVLLGSMSIVGPRPDVIDQRLIYTDQEWGLRVSVRPGITGLAQATLRSDATISERKSLDIFYVENHSFLFDLKIMGMTFRQIICKGGN